MARPSTPPWDQGSVKTVEFVGGPKCGETMALPGNCDCVTVPMLDSESMKRSVGRYVEVDPNSIRWHWREGKP